MTSIKGKGKGKGIEPCLPFEDPQNFTVKFFFETLGFVFEILMTLAGYHCESVHWAKISMSRVTSLSDLKTFLFEGLSFLKPT